MAYIYVYKLDRATISKEWWISEHSFNSKCEKYGIDIDIDYRRTPLYIGYTGLDLEERISRHLNGIQAGRKWISKYGLYNDKDYPHGLLGYYYDKNISKEEELDIGHWFANQEHLVIGPNLEDLPESEIEPNPWITSRKLGQPYKYQKIFSEFKWNPPWVGGYILKEKIIK